MKVQAQHLQPGDVIASGETVLSVQIGLRTPKGKCEVLLQSPINTGWRKMSHWGKYTMINVERNAVGA